MNDEQRVQSISDIIEEKVSERLATKLKPLSNRLDILEVKQNRTTKKLDNLQLDCKIFERTANEKLHILQDEMSTVIEVLKL